MTRDWKYDPKVIAARELYEDANHRYFDPIVAEIEAALERGDDVYLQPDGTALFGAEARRARRPTLDELQAILAEEEVSPAGAGGNGGASTIAGDRDRIWCEALIANVSFWSKEFKGIIDYVVSKAPDAIVPDRSPASPDARPSTDAKESRRALRDMLEQVLQNSWNDYCGDAGFIPDGFDIARRRGKPPELTVDFARSGNFLLNAATSLAHELFKAGWSPPDARPSNG
jgi:hypothetical protein